MVKNNSEGPNQELFDHFAEEHNLVMTQGEMSDIIHICTRAMAETVIKILDMDIPDDAKVKGLRKLFEVYE